VVITIAGRTDDGCLDNLRGGKQMNLSIRMKIVLITLAILCLAVGANALLSSYVFTREYSDALQSKMLVVGRGLALQLDRLLGFDIPLDELVGFEKQCREIVEKYEEVSYAMVVDTNGKILFHNDPAQQGQVLTDSAMLKAVSGAEDVIQVYSQRGEKYYDITIPVFGNSGEHVGAVKIGFPEKIVSEKTQSLLAYAGVVGTVSLALAIGLLVAALSKWVTNPLMKLQAAVREMREKGAADLIGRVEIGSKDEIGVLAQAFNGMAVELHEALTGLEERARELEASQRVTFIASQRMTADDLLNMVVNLVRDQFDLYHAQVYMIDEEKGAAVLRQSTGYAGGQLLQHQHQIPLDATTLVTQAIRTGQAVVVADVAGVPGFVPNLLLPDTKSELIVPLKVGSEVIGALDVHSRAPGRFTPASVALFQTMAEQVAMSFDNNILLARTAQQAAALAQHTVQLRAAAEMAQRLNSILDPDQLLPEVVDLLQSRFGLYHAHIYVLEADTASSRREGESQAGKLVVRAGSGEVGRVLCEQGHSISLEAPKNLVARVARTREAVSVADTSLVSDFVPNPLLPQTRSELAVPLVAGDQVLGVLDVQDVEAGRFGPSDLDVFTSLAGQIATALQNASLFEAHKQAEEKLTEERRLLHTMMDSLPDYIYVKDMECRFILNNTAHLQQALGVTSQAEALGKTDLDVFPRELAEHYYADDQAVVRTGQPVSNREELVMEQGTGASIWVTSTKVPLRDGQGKIIGLVGISRDITERRQAEEAIRASQQRFQGLVETLSDWIWEVNANGQYTYVSPKVTDLLGYAPEEVLGKTPFDLMPPEEAGRVAAIFGPIASAQQPIVAMENTNVHKDGHLVVFETNGLPFYDAAGQFLGYRGTDRDITERKQAEAALRESEDRFRSIVEHSHTGIFTIDNAFHFIYTNDRMAEIVGYSPEEMIGMDFRKLLTEESLRLVSDYYVRRQKGEKVPDRYEMAFVRKDGERRAGELSASAARDAAGNIRTLGHLLDITERKQAQEAVRQSQQMLQLVMNNIPQSIFWKDRNLTYLGCNDNFAQDAGKVSPEEVVGKTDYDMPWLDQAELYRADDQRVMDANQPVLGYEEPQTTPDGSQIWLRTSKVPLHDAEGQVMAVLGMYEDITERKRAEAERERFTTQLSTAADVATQVSAILDPDILLRAVIPLVLDQFKLYHVHVYILDKAAGELVLRAGYGEPGRIMLECGHKIPLESEQSLVARAARSKEAVLTNDTQLAPDFLPNPLLPETRSEVAVPLIASGQVLGVFDVQHNQAGYFTEADVDVFTTLAGQIATAFQNAALFNQVERSLEETRVRFEVSQALAGAQTEEEVLNVLVQQMGLYPKAQVGIDLIDSGAAELTFVVRRNAAFDSGLAGHEPGMRFSATQFRLAQRFSPDAPFVTSNAQLDERFDSPSREFARKVGYTSIAILPITAGTEWLGVIAAFSPEEGYFDEDKLHLYQTVAEQGAVALRIARLYDETQRTAERLKEVDRLKSEFLANMSHELRTPLNSILGYTEVMLMGIDGEMDPETKADVQAIYDNGQHLLHLISDILDLAKIEAGRLNLNFETADIRPLINDVVTSTNGLLLKQQKPVEFIVEVAEDLPAVQVDRLRLNQILNNLLSNAVKFTEEGHITLRAFHEDGHVCLEVQDTGLGIKPDDLDDIFEKFRQVDGSYKRRAEGTGLGLAITRHLVEMHGGSINVCSQPGEGSTFTVRLPIQCPEVEKAPASSDGQSSH
jgi:PAS domain S-box-containing protein